MESSPPSQLETPFRVKKREEEGGRGGKRGKMVSSFGRGEEGEERILHNSPNCDGASHPIFLIKEEERKGKREEERQGCL